MRRLILSRWASSSSSSLRRGPSAAWSARTARSGRGSSKPRRPRSAARSRAEDDRVYLQRDVVARDDVLRRNLERFLPQRDAHHAVDRREDQDDAGPLRLGKQAAEAEDYAALVLGQDLDRAEDVENNDDNDDPVNNRPIGTSAPPSGTLLRRIVSQLYQGYGISPGIGVPRKLPTRARAVRGWSRLRSRGRGQRSCNPSTPRPRPTAGGYTARGHGIPEFAVNKDFAARREGGLRHADFSYHPLSPVTTLLARAFRAMLMRNTVITPSGMLTASAVRRCRSFPEWGRPPATARREPW